MKKISFNECPRPQFVRKDWKNLDGKWGFKFGNNNETDKFENGFQKEFDILVPFAYQTKLSGVNIQQRHDSVWYEREINITKKEHHRYILHLEGADYEVHVFVNGKLCGTDFGCYHRMSFDITDALNNNEKNLLVINCKDDYCQSKPRGKQRWKDESFTCYYVDTTGIYKSVWLEEVNETSISNVEITPNLDNKSVTFLAKLSKEVTNFSLVSKISFNGKDIVSKNIEISGDSISFEIVLPNPVHIWELNEGNLYDVTFILTNDKNEIIDEVSSYFGLRKISSSDGIIKLNNKPLYQKLVLDQGYWKDSDLTPPSNKALFKDIELMRKMGFNGCRKHQKIEDERFLYYCDVLGFLVWLEMPSCYEFNLEMNKCVEKEWLNVVNQMYNHPSIITLVAFNESWGVPEIKTDKDQQLFVEKIVNLTKEVDSTRLVISNDGWQHVKDDVLTIHHYEQDGEKLSSYFSNVEKCTQEVFEGHDKGAYADGYKYEGQPIILSEFGGIAFEDKNSKNWGYGTSVKSNKEFLSRLESMIKGIQKNKHIVGYCLTQLSDVHQEVNGVLYFDHKCKVNPKLIRKIQK